MKPEDLLLENEKMEEIILDNIPAIEHAIEASLKELNSIWNDVKAIDNTDKRLSRQASKTVEPEDIGELCAEVKVNIDDFLGLKSMAFPQCRHVISDNVLSITGGIAYYNIERREIILKEGLSKARFAKAIAHEYAHHIQIEKIGRRPKEYSMSEEGYATGVEKHSMKRLAEHDTDYIPAYLTAACEVSHSMFMGYLSVCNKKGRRHSKQIGILEVTQEYIESKAFEEYAKKNSHYFLGNTIFQLYENIYGAGIYREVLKR